MVCLSFPDFLREVQMLTDGFKHEYDANPRRNSERVVDRECFLGDKQPERPGFQLGRECFLGDEQPERPGFQPSFRQAIALPSPRPTVQLSPVLA